MSFSSHCRIENLRGKFPPEEFLYIFIYIYKCSFSIGLTICYCKKGKASNAFSLMNLLYKDTRCVFDACNGTKSHLYSQLCSAQLGRAQEPRMHPASYPGLPLLLLAFWFSPLSLNFWLFRLVSKKSTSSPQHCSRLPDSRTNWSDSKTLLLFFTLILSIILQSISDEKKELSSIAHTFKWRRTTETNAHAGCIVQL